MSRINKIRVFAIFFAAMFMAYGVWRGEMTIIFKKAVRICMECIGLG